jgi:truncated hemoglobin YjbI
LYDCIKVQTFFRTGGLQKYFVVNLGEVEDKENLGDKRRLKRRLAEFQLTQESVKQDLQILEDAAKTNRTG